MRQILVSALICVLLSMSVVGSFAQTTGTIRCGDIVDGEIIPGQSQTAEEPLGRYTMTFDAYALELQAGTRVNLTVEPLGDTFNVALALVDSGGNDVALLNDGAIGEPESFIDFQIASANQVLRILGVRPNSSLGTEDFYWHYTADTPYPGNFFGAYRISLGCTLPGPEPIIILPGELPPTENGPNPAQTVAPQFSGFGFPGVAPVDFSSGIEIPLQLGQTQTAPIATDVALYTYEAAAGSNARLAVSRLSGDISIGVSVINFDTNEVIFIGGMPSGDNLGIDLTFPTNGKYAIGVFRLDTLERSGTSGAIQIRLSN